MNSPRSTSISGPRHYAESPRTQDAEVLPCQLMVLHGHVKDVVHFRVPSGQRIITGSDDGTIRVWDLENGAEIGDRWPVDDYRISVTSLALSPNGITLASGYKNGLVRSWDIRTGKVIVEWTGHTDKVRSICWSPDGERVASGFNDGTVRMRYGQSGKPVLGLNPMMNSEYKDVYTVAYSPDGTRIAVGGEEKNALNIWDAKTGELLSTVEFQEERSFIITGGSEESELGCIGQPVFSLVWSSDGKKLICGFQCGWIRVFDTATWQEIAIINLGRTLTTQGGHGRCSKRGGAESSPVVVIDKPPWWARLVLLSAVHLHNTPIDNSGAETSVCYI